MKVRLAIALLVLVAGVGPARGQSLGDAAEKEKERRRTAANGGTSHVFTEDDLKANNGQLANDPGAPAPATRGADEQAPAASEGPSGQLSWHRRVEQAQARLLKAKQRLDALQQRVVVPHRGAPVQGVQDQVARAQDEVNAAQRALDDLMEAARKQNVPPGWLR